MTLRVNVNGTANPLFLHPGMLIAMKESSVITTVLGSCISVCLWDRASGAGGMNHYLLPLWNGEGLKTPRYGNVAIPALIEKMLSLGCNRKDLRAKVFGGAAMLDSKSSVLNIGRGNIEYAEGALAEAGIPVLCRDTGGTYGRKLMFKTGTGEVLLKRVNGVSKS